MFPVLKANLTILCLSNASIGKPLQAAHQSEALARLEVGCRRVDQQLTRHNHTRRRGCPVTVADCPKRLLHR
jgi:hypothetical protein